MSNKTRIFRNKLREIFILEFDENGDEISRKKASKKDLDDYKEKIKNNANANGKRKNKSKDKNNDKGKGSNK